MPRIILIILAVIAVAFACGYTVKALDVSQPVAGQTAPQYKFNPQQPGLTCLQNCHPQVAPPNVMGY